MWLADPGRLKLGSEGDDEEQGLTRRFRDGHIKELAGCRIDPMDIFDYQQHRALSRQALKPIN
jgi:hypothetical protein